MLRKRTYQKKLADENRKMVAGEFNFVILTCFDEIKSALKDYRQQEEDFASQRNNTEVKSLDHN